MKDKELNPDALELCRRYFTKGSVLEIPDKTEKGLLSDLSEEYRTYEVCKIAVEANPKNLLYVPKKHLTKEIYTIAVKGEPSFAYTVPRNKLTEEICIEALKHLNVKLNWVPRRLRTAEVCHAGIEKEKGALKIVPSRSRSYSLCLKAVKYDGANLKFVPRDKLNDQLCVAAIMQHPQAKQFVPEDNMTPAVYKAMIQQKLILLRDVPFELIDAEMCKIALSVATKSSDVVPYLPIHLLDDPEVQPLLSSWLEKDAKEFKLEQKPSKTLDEIIAECTKYTPKEPEKTKPQPEEGSFEAYIDYFPY